MADAGEIGGVPKSLNGMRKEHIARVLEAMDYDLDRAAAILAIPSTELAQWMAKYGFGQRNGASRK